MKLAISVEKRFSSGRERVCVCVWHEPNILRAKGTKPLAIYTYYCSYQM